MTNEEKLFCAIGNDDIATVTTLLDANPELINAQDYKNGPGYTPLHIAKSNEMVVLLLARGAGVNSPIGGWTPLFTVSAPDMAVTLIENGADVNARTKVGVTPLHNQTGNSDVAAVILEYGADIEAQMKNGDRPLHYAARLDPLWRDSYLIDKGLPPKYAPLVECRWEDQIGGLELLLRRGAQVDITNNSGKTPLYCAATSGFLDAVDILIAYGANVKFAKPDGATPMHGIAYSDRYYIVKSLCNAGADINATDNEGMTPLDWALIMENGVTAQFLRKYGGISLSPITDIFIAASKGYAERVSELLREKPALAFAKDMVNATPIFRAAQYGSVEVAELLVAAGADVNSEARFLGMPIHVAVENGRIDMVNFLIKNGADLCPKSMYKDLPLNIAKRCGHTEIAETLIAQGGG